MSNKEKIFYVVNIKRDKSPFIYSYLNSLKFIVSPRTRTRAHVTVRGPKNGKLNKEQRKRLNQKLGNYLVINGVGSFFYSNQNTVYLSCRTDEVEDVWDKPDYGDGINPHLTIYDGDEKSYAEDVLSILGKNTKIKFKIKNIELDGLISGRNDFIRLRSRINDEDIERSTGLGVSVSEVAEMEKEDRLKLVFLIWRRLSYVRYKVNGCIREGDFRRVDVDTLNRISVAGYQFKMFPNTRGVSLGSMGGKEEVPA